jgi:hypothetical protein
MLEGTAHFRHFADARVEFGELLFEDRFTSSGLDPLATSPGQSGGWAYLPPGWTVWPGRSVNDRAGPGGLPGFVELDAASGDGFENARMGRAFLLTPGFYQLRYVYSVGPNSPHKAPKRAPTCWARIPRPPGCAKWSNPWKRNFGSVRLHQRYTENAAGFDESSRVTYASWMSAVNTQRSTTDDANHIAERG